MQSKNLLFSGQFFLLILFLFGTAVMTSSCKKEKQGCTDLFADNYDPEAVVDDGSCFTTISGCMDPNALNYNKEANEDKGCLYPPEKPTAQQLAKTTSTGAPARKVVLLEYTATWCGPCGSWGGAAFHQLVENNKENAVAFGVHASPSDVMYNNVAAAFKSNFDITGWPNFYAGNYFAGTSTMSASNKVNEYMGQPFEGTVAVNYTIHGGKVLVEAATKFHENVTGHYNMGVYLLENNISGAPGTGEYEQLDGGADYTHEHVLRATASFNEWGDEVASGSASAGTVVNKSYTIPVQQTWNAGNLEVVVVLWKLDTSTGLMQYVNANK